jgi:hypothetical protein
MVPGTVFFDKNLSLSRKKVPGTPALPSKLSIEAVCAALKNRGGFTGNYDDLVKHVKQFFDAAAYQLCDGFAESRGAYYRGD